MTPPEPPDSWETPPADVQPTPAHVTLSQDTRLGWVTGARGKWHVAIGVAAASRRRAVTLCGRWPRDEPQGYGDPELWDHIWVCDLAPFLITSGVGMCPDCRARLGLPDPNAAMEIVEF